MIETSFFITKLFDYKNLKQSADPVYKVYRGKYRVFVGNTQEISSSDLEAKFSEFGKVIECDLKGAYGFVG